MRTTDISLPAPAVCTPSETKCITEYPTEGVVTWTSFTDGNNQQIDLNHQGNVTTGSTSWPFKVGSGMNDQFKGDDVVDIEFATHGDCADNESGDILGPGPCAQDHGYLFVFTPSNTLVDVVASNQTGQAQYLTAITVSGQKEIGAALLYDPNIQTWYQDY